jgi:hypothetical protein
LLVGMAGQGRVGRGPKAKGGREVGSQDFDSRLNGK